MTSTLPWPLTKVTPMALLFSRMESPTMRPPEASGSKTASNSCGPDRSEATGIWSTLSPSLRAMAVLVASEVASRSRASPFWRMVSRPVAGPMLRSTTCTLVFSPSRALAGTLRRSTSTSLAYL